MSRFFGFVLVVLLLCVVALVSAAITMHFAIHGAEVVVPDLTGLTVTDALRKAASQELNLSVDNRFYSAEMPSGRVLTQTPASGTVVRREWRVRITESLGPQRIPIPNVIGQQERAATISIRRAGFDLGNVAHMPYVSAPEATVIAQNPRPDAEGVERPSMSLLVADAGADITNNAVGGVVMPDLTGQLLAAATAAVTSAGLHLAPPLEIQTGVSPLSTTSAQNPATPQPPGTVIGQSPAAGHRVDADTQVQLTVAR